MSVTFALLMRSPATLPSPLGVRLHVLHQDGDLVQLSVAQDYAVFPYVLVEVVDHQDAAAPKAAMAPVTGARAALDLGLPLSGPAAADVVVSPAAV